MATMKTLNGFGFNATEFNGKTSDSYLQLGADETGSTGAAPTIKAGTFGGMTVSQFVDMIYPVGSIYMSVVSTSPATLFGGTWEQLQDRFLLAAGSTYSAGSTGGEATHTLTVDEIPSHTHEVTRITSSSGGSTGTGYGREQKAKTQRDHAYGPYPTGGGQSHNNMPPYLAVYTWKRTA